MKLCPLLRSFSALLLIAVSLAPTAARAQDDAGLTVFAAARLYLTQRAATTWKPPA